MKTTIYFRTSDEDSKAEKAICERYFPTVSYRTKCQDSLVIPRYSALPFYNELCEDLKNSGCTPINSFEQHRWIADFLWYQNLKEFTPKTWFDRIPTVYEYSGPMILKGRTNSRKYDWNNSFYAADTKAACKVWTQLNNDYLIGSQGIICREYIPLETFEIGLNGVRFSNEWRFFFLNTSLLAYGYYWSSATPETVAMANRSIENYTSNRLLLQFAQECANICSQHTNFFVLDVAKTEQGQWILIEVNDGCMSGLSEIKSNVLYSRLKNKLESW